MSAKFPDFVRDDGARGTLLEWWRRLESDRASRAELRRCNDPEEVVYVPAFHWLLSGLRREGFGVSAERLALVAGVVAAIREHRVSDGSGPAAQLGGPKGEGGSARMSHLRFRRLLTAEHGPERMVQLRRAIALLGGAADVPGFAAAAYLWNDRTKRQWALDYYSKAPEERSSR